MLSARPIPDQSGTQPGSGSPAAVTGAPPITHAGADADRRTALLAAVARIAQRFVREDDWRAAVPGALAELGEAAGVGRVYVFENHAGPEDRVHHSLRFEWLADDVHGFIDDPSMQNMPIGRDPVPAGSMRSPPAGPSAPRWRKKPIPTSAPRCSDGGSSRSPSSRSTSRARGGDTWPTTTWRHRGHGRRANSTRSGRLPVSWLRRSNAAGIASNAMPPLRSIVPSSSRCPPWSTPSISTAPRETRWARAT